MNPTPSAPNGDEKTDPMPASRAETISDEEALALVRGYLESGEWWVLPWVSPPMMRLSMYVEEKYYDSLGFSDDFQAVAIGLALGPLPISFAKRTRMTGAQLKDAFLAILPPGIDASFLGDMAEAQQPLVYIITGPDDYLQALLLKNWLRQGNWVPKELT